MPTITLEPVDSLDVTIVVDNAIDILAAPSEVARRQPWPYEWVYRDQLRAEQYKHFRNEMWLQDLIAVAV